MSRYKFISWTALTIALILLVLPRLIPICTGQAKLATGMASPMPCHYAFQVVFIISLLAVIAATALFAVRTAEARSLAGFFLLLLGISVIILPQPWAVGICPHGGACAKTAFFTAIGGGLLGLSGLAVVWLNRSIGREDTAA